MVLVASSRVEDLSCLRGRSRWEAPSGEHGRGGRQRGRDGRTLEIPVPLGTLVWEGRRLLGDLSREGMRLVVARGGRGGRGNASLVTPTDQAPARAEPGQRGRARRLRLELRLPLEVAILGLPNAGKSALLTRLCGARPRVAPWPFTTLVPQLGVLQLEEALVRMAEIPPLAPGGGGPGARFLRHAERARLLLQLLDGTADPREQLRALEEALAAHGGGLAEKARLPVVNKLDLPEVRRARPRLEQELPGAAFVSALTGEGIPELREEIARRALT